MTDPRQHILRARQERAAMRETRVVFAQADAAYTGRSCPASGDCCQLAVTKREPWLWRAEWLVLEEEARRVHGALPPLREDGACPLLDATGRRCSVYPGRPLGCRTFFCGRMTGGDHPREAMAQALTRLERIAQALDEDATGPRTLLDWYGRSSQ